MKPIQKVKSFSLPVRLLLGLLFALGLAIPTALASSSGPADNNYIIYPPADQNTYLGKNGPRLQFLIHNDFSGTGSSAGYAPNQFLIASSEPKVTFEMRGGRWSPANETSRDYYDRKDAPARAGGTTNPDWVVNYTKSVLGFLSPVYYEVYQLSGDNLGNGTLLGVINPRDSNIFPYPDDDPSSDTCSGGGCWRQFSVDGSGGSITLDGSQQDSCAKRLANHSNQCYSSTAIAMAGSSPYSHVFASNGAQARQYSSMPLPVWETYFGVENDFEGALALRAPPTNTKPSWGKSKSKNTGADLLAKYGTDLKTLLLGEPAQATNPPPTHTITVNVNPASKTAGVVVEMKDGSGNHPCNDSTKTVPTVGTSPNGQGYVVFGGCPEGHQYTAAVSPSSFNVPNGACGIGDTSDFFGDITGDTTTTITYTCNHQIRVTVSPTGHTGGHVTVKMYDNTDSSQNCSGTPTGENGGVQKGVVDQPGPPPGADDGTVTFGGCRDGDAFTAWVAEDRFDDAQGDFHCEIGSNPKSQVVGSDAKASFKYDCYQARNDDATISGGSFGKVQGQRFSSLNERNLNGNYVFLIKTVAYSDIGHGYVDFDRFKLANNTSQGCPYNFANPGLIGCPSGLFREANNHPEHYLVQDGFYLRAPKYQNSFSDRQYLASASSKIAFGINYGPSPQNNGQGHYEGLTFAGGGSACRAAPEYHPLDIPNADWDKPKQNPIVPGFDTDISAFVNRSYVMDDRGNLQGLGSASQEQGVDSLSISGDWVSQDNNFLPVNNININRPDQSVSDPSSFFNPPWQNMENGHGILRISNWDDGNELLQGGQPFTTGFWPTCRASPGPTGPVPLTPKSVDSGYKYDGQDSITSNPFGSDPNAVLNFNFLYNLPEFRAKVDWRVDISPNSSFSGLTLQSAGTDLNVEAPGAKSASINTNGLQANTDYYWRGCINDQVNSDRCTSTTKFRINKGPSVAPVSADPNNPTDSGNVNYNCSKLAMILTDPEGNQVRPYFTATWTDSSGQINTVSSYDRSGLSDSWSSWVSGNGYKASGSTFTSDEVRPKVWTVNGVRRSVPNKTFTQFLQQDVPESANVTWVGQGEDQYGASDLSDLLIPGSSPIAARNAGFAADQQSPLSNRRFGPPASTNYHKNTRPNLNTASTKKFKDFSGTPVTSVTDGQTVQVETKLVNGGETPTKSYQIADYIGSIRDFDPPITNDPTHPITVQYNGGAKTTVSPAVSAVIPNHQNGNLDQPENAASTNDDRQASYKLNFGANPLARSPSMVKGEDFTSCQTYGQPTQYCLTNDTTYPDAAYWYAGGFETNIPGNDTDSSIRDNAVATWRIPDGVAVSDDLTLQYYNYPVSQGPNGSLVYPPPGYSFHVKVEVVTPTGSTTGSKTVNLPIESTVASRDLHTYTISGLDLEPGSSIRLTWDNNYRVLGQYNTNFGLNQLKFSPSAIPSGSILRPGELAPGESITLDYYIRADRNHDTITNQNLQNSDQNQNFQRRLGVGSTASPQPAPSADPNGGTIDIGDAHTFVPFSEDYCNTNNPLINHTCEFKPGDVLAPFLRTQRGSVASNGGVFGYDALAGTSNATFLVQANGVLSHFTSQTGTLPNYASQQAVCTAQGERPGGVDWRRTMIANINKLNGGTKNPTHTNTGPLLNPGDGTPRGKLDGPGNSRNGNVWVVGSPSVPEDLTIDNPIQFNGVGTILVFGNLTIGPNANLTYAPDTNGVNSLGVIVVGNLTIDPTVTNLVGSYYVLDSQPSVDANGCPVGIDPAKTTRGLISTGSSSTRLNVQGLLVAGKFDFLRYFTNPSDSEADPAENVYYDGRVLANTPPGFGTFRNTASWYEIAP